MMMFAALEVAVDDAGGVRGGDAGGDLPGNAEELAPTRPAAAAGAAASVSPSQYSMTMKGTPSSVSPTS